MNVKFTKNQFELLLEEQLSTLPNTITFEFDDYDAALKFATELQETFKFRSLEQTQALTQICERIIQAKN